MNKKKWPRKSLAAVGWWIGAICLVVGAAWGTMVTARLSTVKAAGSETVRGGDGSPGVGAQGSNSRAAVRRNSPIQRPPVALLTSGGDPLTMQYIAREISYDRGTIFYDVDRVAQKLVAVEPSLVHQLRSFLEQDVPGAVGPGAQHGADQASRDVIERMAALDVLMAVARIYRNERLGRDAQGAAGKLLTRPINRDSAEASRKVVLAEKLEIFQSLADLDRGALVDAMGQAQDPWVQKKLADWWCHLLDHRQ